jgi:1-acyl-sn-glycerol-3-phosphate acyltransferase
MLAALAEGSSLIIFPEGTRRDGEDLGEFKAGLYHLAKARPDLEFIPVYIENLNRVLPKGEFLPVPILCSVNFGAALEAPASDPKPQFLARAREAVRLLQPQ